MFTYNILIYQFEPEPLILRGFPALLIHLSVENGIIKDQSLHVKQNLPVKSHFFQFTPEIIIRSAIISGVN